MIRLVRSLLIAPLFVFVASCGGGGGGGGSNTAAASGGQQQAAQSAPSVSFSSSESQPEQDDNFDLTWSASAGAPAPLRGLGLAARREAGPKLTPLQRSEPSSLCSRARILPEKQQKQCP